jgi:tRNA threonylcarbamoyl adenosine modification protein YeaZ
MLVLAISSSTSCHSAALADGTSLLAETFVGTPQRHAEFLPKVIADLFEYSGRVPSEIDAVSVDVGPGQYTGLRAGMAAAKAIGLALGKPLIPVPSLWAIAHRACSSIGPQVIVVSDARRKEIYWQIFPPLIEELASALLLKSDRTGYSGEDAIKLGRIEDFVDDLQALKERLGDYVIAGEGGKLYRDEIAHRISERMGIEPPRVLDDYDHPTASAVARAAHALTNHEPKIAIPPENVPAIYMRAADAVRIGDRRAASMISEEVFI